MSRVFHRKILAFNLKSIIMYDILHSTNIRDFFRLKFFDAIEIKRLCCLINLLTHYTFYDSQKAPTN